MPKQLFLVNFKNVFELLNISVSWLSEEAKLNVNVF